MATSSVRGQRRPQPIAASSSPVSRDRNHGASPPFPTGGADDGDAVRSPLMVPAFGTSLRVRGELPFSPPPRPLSPQADQVSQCHVPHHHYCLWVSASVDQACRSVCC
ncbi:hypothetical protein NDU88_002374 [Pleurodeles waltl]|uniref:Uncharacterized protein n=1 Tax=Pleurodeles waltl TaxID=8319 RepID=A0AAV7VDJ1_PLEWA|nr:hypothetical protein NDU88_002374 [Pleurodeles waltl]